MPINTTHNEAPQRHSGALLSDFRWSVTLSSFSVDALNQARGYCRGGRRPALQTFRKQRASHCHCVPGWREEEEEEEEA